MLNCGRIEHDTLVKVDASLTSRVKATVAGLKLIKNITHLILYFLKALGRIIKQ